MLNLEYTFFFLILEIIPDRYRSLHSISECERHFKTKTHEEPKGNEKMLKYTSFRGNAN